MKYQIGDKFLLDDIECKVAHISNNEQAYLVPLYDGGTYNNIPLWRGLVFAIINKKGYDTLGNKVVSLPRKDCGAV